MFSSPTKNLNNFCKTRPPLIIFLICIIALTIATFSFAFYIENNDKIINSDFKNDWARMLKHFNKLTYCVETLSESNKYNNLDNKHNENEFISESQIQTTITIENVDQLLKKFANVEGYLTLEDWEATCPRNNEKPKNLKILFNMPFAHNVTSICVTIKGPEEYLPKFSKPVCEVANKDFNKKPPGVLISKNNKYLEESFCKHGAKTSFQFDLDKTEDFSIFLSKEDKSIIYIHLMWISYLLVIVILATILYAVLHKQNIEEKSSNNYRIS